jgi:hypothetical protein
MEKAGGFVILVFCILGFVQIPLGGVFRTEVTAIPAVSGQIAGEVPFSETMTARHWLMGYIQGEQPDVPKVLAKSISARGSG